MDFVKNLTEEEKNNFFKVKIAEYLDSMTLEEQLDYFENMKKDILIEFKTVSNKKRIINESIEKTIKKIKSRRFSVSNKESNNEQFPSY